MLEGVGFELAAQLENAVSPDIVRHPSDLIVLTNIALTLYLTLKILFVINNIRDKQYFIHFTIVTL